MREAIARALDIPSAVDALTGGKGLAAYTISSPAAPYYPQVEQAITKHTHDMTRAQQLLEDAGLRKAADGFYVNPPALGGDRFHLEVWCSSGVEWEREASVVVDDLRKAGIDAEQKVTPAAMIRDAKARSTTPGLSIRGHGHDRFANFTSDAIPSPDNRWFGNNQGAWSSPDYDRAYVAFSTTLDRTERIKHIAEMETALNQDTGAIPYMFTVVVTAYTGNLKGPVARKTPDAGIGPVNIHEWEWVK